MYIVTIKVKVGHHRNALPYQSNVFLVSCSRLLRPINDDLPACPHLLPARDDLRGRKLEAVGSCVPQLGREGEPEPYGLVPVIRGSSTGVQSSGVFRSEPGVVDFIESIAGILGP